MEAREASAIFRAFSRVHYITVRARTRRGRAAESPDQDRHTVTLDFTSLSLVFVIKTTLGCPKNLALAPALVRDLQLIAKTQVVAQDHPLRPPILGQR